MNLIESIENIINESEDSASKTIDKIKTVISILHEDVEKVRWDA